MPTGCEMAMAPPLQEGVSDAESGPGGKDAYLGLIFSMGIWSSSRQ